MWICITSCVDSDAAFHANADPNPYPFFHDTNLSILFPQAVLRIRDVYPRLHWYGGVTVLLPGKVIWK